MSEVLEHIDGLFADATYKAFKAKRYGIKSCPKPLEIDHLADIREVYKRSLELDKNEMKLASSCCSLNKITEHIKTL